MGEKVLVLVKVAHLDPPGDRGPSPVQPGAGAPRRVVPIRLVLARGRDQVDALVQPGRRVELAYEIGVNARGDVGVGVAPHEVAGPVHRDHRTGRRIDDRVASLTQREVADLLPDESRP